MPSLRLQWGLPLLGKELAEQAARKRTYVVRAAYACLLFCAAYLMFHDELRLSSATPMSVLGRGRQMFETLIKLQFAGVFLFMPAIMCSVVAQEKERNTLPLLLLTRLGPWTILIEKYLSRVLPMLGFLLMSLPLLAFAYSLGGLSQTALWSGVWMLSLTVLQLGAVSLLCSAWFRTTFGAFIGAYVACAALMLGPLLLLLVGSLFNPNLSVTSIDRWVWRNTAGTGTGVLLQRDSLLFPFFAPFQLFHYEWTVARPVLHLVIPTGRSALAIFAASLPILFSTVVSLVLSRVVLLRRLSVGPQSGLQRLFQRLDRTFARWNQNRFTRGIVLIGDKAALPDARPVAWRETTKRSLGRARYLVRIALVMEAAFWTLLIMIALFSDGEGQQFMKLVALLMWLVAVLLVAVQSATLIAGERGHQTLDVLCATPLEGREIILQKYTAVRRLIAVLWIPMGPLILLQAGSFQFNLLAAFLSVAIYLPLVAWISMWIGLKVKSRARGIIVALALLAGWCVLPIVFIFMPLTILLGQGAADSWLGESIFLSPAMMVVMNGGFVLSIRAVTWNFVLYGAILFMVRRECLVHADRLLGRAENPRGKPVAQTAEIEQAVAAAPV